MAEFPRSVEVAVDVVIRSVRWGTEAPTVDELARALARTDRSEWDSLSDRDHYLSYATRVLTNLTPACGDHTVGFEGQALDCVLPGGHREPHRTQDGATFTRGPS